jgi:uncharacterized protein
VRFWDSSALVPLFIEEETTSRLRQIYREDRGAFVWWGSSVECASAFARLEHAGEISARDATQLSQELDLLAVTSWQPIEPVEAIRETARRFLRVHPLRAADALQLAAAFYAAESKPSTLGFVCLDERLGTAAQREGFRLLDWAGLT